MVGPQQAHADVSSRFEGLAHHRRRAALRCLQEYGTPIPLADLADEVAVREYDTALPEIPAENVTRIYMSLYHTHIPKLADAEYVRYDQERDAVTLRAYPEQFDQIRARLETDRSVTNR
ncbi:DUF7344 domain-containing protein [Natronorubrum sp. DTA28]|uniref:DUF7344 domain-containing protein n=1 Tax=Natronorubrum sp. DTA28 TaxID=3447019 RepID=UPI003F82A64F